MKFSGRDKLIIRLITAVALLSAAILFVTLFMQSMNLPHRFPYPLR